MATAYNKIETRTLASVASSIQFTSIPQTYGMLLAKVSAAYDGTGRTDMYVTFNSDASSGYYTTRALWYDGNNKLWQDNTTQGASVAVPGNSYGARFTAFEFFLPNYNQSSYKKGIFQVGGYAAATNQAFLEVNSYYNTNNSDAVNSLKFSTASGNFAVGTKISLYGLSKS